MVNISEWFLGEHFYDMNGKEKVKYLILAMALSFYRFWLPFFAGLFTLPAFWLLSDWWKLPVMVGFIPLFIQPKVTMNVSKLRKNIEVR